MIVTHAHRWNGSLHPAAMVQICLHIGFTDDDDDDDDDIFLCIVSFWQFTWAEMLKSASSESPPWSLQSTAPSHPRASAVDHGLFPPAGRVVPCRPPGRHKPLGLGQPRPGAKMMWKTQEQRILKNQNYCN